MTTPARGDLVTVAGTGAPPHRVVRRAVERVFDQERRSGAVGVTFLGPRRMRRLHASHLGHDAVTDVLSFSLLQPDGTLAGDIYVCRYAAARNARAHGSTVRTELIRLVVHGTLHVLGYDHPADASRTLSPMWQRQERYLAALA